MCGRYVSPDTASIERQWQLRRSSGNPLPRRYNVAPAADIPFLLLEQRDLTLATGRWGLVPHWWKQPKPPRYCHNARLEEAAAKPMWRDAMARWRCVVPAAGWYEWRESDRQPFYFFRRDGRLAGLAGLFSVSVEPETQQARYTCALLTTEARGELAAIHDRMPLALPEAAQAQWLESGATVLAHEQIAFHAVSRSVNGSRADGPQLIEEVAG